MCAVQGRVSTNPFPVYAPYELVSVLDVALANPSEDPEIRSNKIRVCS